MMRNTVAAAAVGMGLLVGGAGASEAQQGATPDRGTEVENLGTVPFVPSETLLLRPDEKVAVRKLEDKYAADLIALRRRQAEEREQLRKSFKR